MQDREWWELSPSSKWLNKKPAGDGSRMAWDLEKKKDPLLGRALAHWAEVGSMEGPQRCGNSEALLEEHCKINGPAVRTRFPPEPNGYLHIGHAKSMNTNFAAAFDLLEKNGVACDRETVFRFDDTNPEAESTEFVESLKEDVAFLGWKPVVTTYSSEYFPVLFALAVELVKRGKAYVCHQTSLQIEGCRKVAKARTALKSIQGVPPPELVAEARADEPLAHQSPFRDRSVAENLTLFEKMRSGQTAEGECTLRLKMDLEATNYNMFDQVAYRVKFASHPHVGDAWCVYPTYDFTHCLVDSLEHIDYSICTLEFETRRESYYWVLDQLDMYRPKVYEMSRLNIAYTVLSKRKLTKLVVAKHVRGWDDPRMPTISGLRRRGFSREVINEFCRDIGVTRNENFIDYSRLQFFARQELEKKARRLMACREPLECLLTGEEHFGAKYEALLFPGDPTRGSRQIALSKTIYIDRSDFQEQDDPSFFGLAPGKSVRLRYSVTIKCESIEKVDGKVTRITCSVDAAPAEEPKGKLHWVSSEAAVKCELRDYDHLFTEDKVDAENWESLVNPQSLKVYPDALVDRAILDLAKSGDPVFQFERIGYYTVDKDTTEDKLVMNQTVELKSAKPQTKGAGASRGEKQAADAAKKEALKSVNPREMFLGMKEYSAFDETGIPAKDALGEPLSKSALKKLKKEWDKQEKTYKAHLKTQQS